MYSLACLGEEWLLVRRVDGPVIRRERETLAASTIQSVAVARVPMCVCVVGIAVFWVDGGLSCQYTLAMMKIDGGLNGWMLLETRARTVMQI